MIEPRSPDDEPEDSDPNQKQSRTLCAPVCTIARSNPLPCCLAIVLLVVILLASGYLFAEDQFRAAQLARKEANKDWFRNRFDNIAQLAKEAQNRIDSEHPGVVEARQARNRRQRVGLGRIVGGLGGRVESPSRARGGKGDKTKLGSMFGLPQPDKRRGGR